MKIHSNGDRFKNNYLYNERLHNPYDYKNDGLIQHIIPRKIFTTTNTTLKWFLNTFDTSMIFVFNYIDKLKHFKNYTNKNR